MRNQQTVIRNAYDTMAKKLKDFLGRSKTDEEKLYNNFTAILNEKKRQIQHLNDLLTAFRQGRPTVNSPVQVKRNKKQNVQKNKKKLNVVPESSSESDSNNDTSNDNYDTDNELSKNNETTKKLEEKDPWGQNNLSPLPSTSKASDEYPPDGQKAQTFTFPKRIRSEPNVRLDSININATKKENIHDEEIPGTSHDILDNHQSDKAARVDFSTQDLLDDL